MQNFDYKTLLYYAPPVVILLFVVGYYIYFKDLPPTKQLENTKGQQVNKSETSLITDAFNDNNFTEANKLADEMLSRDKDNIQALLLKAQNLAQEASLVYKEKELGDQARAIALQVLKLDPNNTAALTLVGYTYEIQENYTQAHKYYDKALEIDPNSVSSLNHKAHAYDLQGDMDKSYALYTKSLKIEPNNIDTTFRLARIFIFKGKFQEAKDMFLLVVEKTENQRQKAESLNNLGYLSVKEGPSQEAENLFMKAIEVDSTFTNPYIGLAKEFFKKFLNEPNQEVASKYLDTSFKNLETALKINPYQSQASIQLAMQMSVIGQKKIAEQTLRNALGNLDKDISLNSVSKDLARKTIETLLKNI